MSGNVSGIYELLHKTIYLNNNSLSQVSTKISDRWLQCQLCLQLTLRTINAPSKKIRPPCITAHDFTVKTDTVI